MPIILGLFCLLPLLLGLALEYLACRLPRRRLWRILPPALDTVFIVLAGAIRRGLWTDEETSPLTQLLIFPGLPGVCALLGCYLGWRVWRYLWRPRVLKGRKIPPGPAGRE